MKIRLEKLVAGKPVNGQTPMLNVAHPVVLPPSLMAYDGAPARFEPGEIYDVPDNVAAALAPFGGRQVSATEAKAAEAKRAAVKASLAVQET